MNRTEFLKELQKCGTAGEIVQAARENGMDITLEQALTMLPTSKLSEKDLEEIAISGKNASRQEPRGKNWEQKHSL